MPPAIRAMKENLRKVSQGLNDLQQSEGLARWALISLLHDRTKVSKSMIRRVLDGTESLIEEAFTDEI